MAGGGRVIIFPLYAHLFHCQGEDGREVTSLHTNDTQVEMEGSLKYSGLMLRGGGGSLYFMLMIPGWEGREVTTPNLKSSDEVGGRSLLQIMVPR
jgi:hypothetical protein